MFFFFEKLKSKKQIHYLHLCLKHMFGILYDLIFDLFVRNNWFNWSILAYVCAYQYP